MALLGQYVFRLTCCAVICNIIMSLIRDGTVKQLVRLIAGVFLTITAISPVKDITIPDMDLGKVFYQQQGMVAAKQGEAYAKAMRNDIIKTSLEAYILDKAATLGCKVNAQIEVNEEGCPVSAVLSGTKSPIVREELEYVLTNELGIAKEDQRWNG